jgi:hypothetical protein
MAHAAHISPCLKNWDVKAKNLKSTPALRKEISEALLHPDAR